MAKAKQKFIFLPPTPLTKAMTEISARWFQFMGYMIITSAIFSIYVITKSVTAFISYAITIAALGFWAGSQIAIVMINMIHHVIDENREVHGPKYLGSRPFWLLTTLVGISAGIFIAYVRYGFAAIHRKYLNEVKLIIFTR